MSLDDAPRMRARGLCKRFGARAVLRGLDLDIAPGETLALFGANGAGKSTLLRIIALIARADAGSLELFGEAAKRRDAAVRSRLGLSLHALALYEELSIEENLRLFATMQGLGADRVEIALERFDLAGRAEDRVGELSRGWQQRTALARSTLHDPLLWLLDEPFVGLDRTASASLDRALADHAARGGSALLVTHDIPRGLALASRWSVLAAGRIGADGATAGCDLATVERAMS